MREISMEVRTIAVLKWIKKCADLSIAVQGKRSVNGCKVKDFLSMRYFLYKNLYGYHG